MDSQPSASRFRTTSWTLVRKSLEHEDDREELFRRYWSPVYAFLRRKGHPPAEAEDLTQGFFCDKVLERDLVERADASRGRFRAYLLTALRRYVIDRIRVEANRPRPRRLPEDPNLLREAKLSDPSDPGEAFERQWAAAVFNEALRLTEESCREAGMSRQWAAFEARVLRPAKGGCAPEPIGTIAAALDVATAQQVSDMIQTVKRKLATELRAAVALTVSDPKDVDQELAELRRLLSGVRVPVRHG